MNTVDLAKRFLGFLGWFSWLPPSWLLHQRSVISATFIALDDKDKAANQRLEEKRPGVTMRRGQSKRRRLPMRQERRRRRRRRRQRNAKPRRIE